MLPARGYHDARVDDIVDAAGVSHGTFYRYFDNKDDFFRVLAEAASARMIELIDRLRIDAAVDELRAWLREWFRTYEADGGVISTWQEMQTNDELAAVLPAGRGSRCSPDSCGSSRRATSATQTSTPPPSSP